MTKGNSLLLKVTLALREKLCKGSVNILLINSYKIVNLYSYVAHSNISFLMLLLLHTHVWNAKVAMPQKLSVGSLQTSRDMNLTVYREVLIFVDQFMALCLVAIGASLAARCIEILLMNQYT
jgi:hypothetical protein